VPGALAQIGWKALARAVRDLNAWENARLVDLDSQLRRDREAKAGQLAAGEDPQHDRIMPRIGG